MPSTMLINRRWCAAVLVASALLQITLPAAYASQATFFDEFGSGWENRWTHSSDSKYNGRLTVESPKSLSDPALKVRTKGPDHKVLIKLLVAVSLSPVLLSI